MSYQPQMYKKPLEYNSITVRLQIKLAQLWIKEIFRKSIIDIKIKGKVLDVGCGTGKVTNEILCKMLENDAVIEACDVSEELLDFARQHYKNIKFFIQDVALPFPTKFLGTYDFIFSNLVLHWVRDHRAAFKNFFDLLKPGGKLALSLIGRHPFFDVLREMAKDKKWAKYMTDVETFISPTHDEENSANTIEIIMTECGFSKIEVKILDRHTNVDHGITYQACKDNFESVDPFVLRIPDNDKEGYLEDCFSRILKIGQIDNPKLEDIAPLCLGGHLIAVYGEK